MLELVHRISKKFRENRSKVFLETFKLENCSGLRILDLGGHPGLSIFENFPHSCEVVYLNIYEESKFRDSLFNNQTYVQGDARKIPFPTSHFDIVYSNSLIEHVGELEEQAKVAHEIMRVGRGYWIQTPYKHFPIEHHYNFPFFQYASKKIKLWIYYNWSYSYHKKNSLDYEEIHLLNIRQVKNLFPNASQFYLEKLGPLTKSIVAIKKIE